MIAKNVAIRLKKRTNLYYVTIEGQTILQSSHRWHQTKDQIDEFTMTNWFFRLDPSISEFYMNALYYEFILDSYTPVYRVLRTEKCSLLLRDELVYRDMQIFPEDLIAF